MKTLALKFCLAVMVLLTSCNSKEKNDTESTDTQSKALETESSIESIDFTDTKWMLVALNGKEISSDNAFISFATEDNRVFGNTSCNNFTGTYEIKEGNRLSMSEIATTMMACPDMTIEDQFMEILKQVDNYSLNGKKMTLNKARMAPLAVFAVAE